MAMTEEKVKSITSGVKEKLLGEINTRNEKKGMPTGAVRPATPTEQPAAQSPAKKPMPAFGTKAMPTFGKAAPQKFPYKKPGAPAFGKKPAAAEAPTEKPVTSETVTTLAEKPEAPAPKYKMVKLETKDVNTGAEKVVLNDSDFVDASDDEAFIAIEKATEPAKASGTVEEPIATEAVAEAAATAETVPEATVEADMVTAEEAPEAAVEETSEAVAKTPEEVTVEAEVVEETKPAEEQASEAKPETVTEVAVTKETPTAAAKEEAPAEDKAEAPKKKYPGAIVVASPPDNWKKQVDKDDDPVVKSSEKKKQQQKKKAEQKKEEPKEEPRAEEESQGNPYAKTFTGFGFDKNFDADKAVNDAIGLSTEFFAKEWEPTFERCWQLLRGIELDPKGPRAQIASGLCVCNRVRMLIGEFWARIKSANITVEVLGNYVQEQSREGKNDAERKANGTKALMSVQFGNKKVNLFASKLATKVLLSESNDILEAVAQTQRILRDLKDLYVNETIMKYKKVNPEDMTVDGSFITLNAEELIS